MTPERWQEVKKVLASALELKPEERRVYLDQACPELDLRREVNRSSPLTNKGTVVSWTSRWMQTRN
jgi:hypothetical protein